MIYDNILQTIGRTPIVRLNNGIFSLFSREPENRASLPLPGLSPLPRRF